VPTASAWISVASSPVVPRTIPKDNVGLVVRLDWMVVALMAKTATFAITFTKKRVSSSSQRVEQRLLVRNRRSQKKRFCTTSHGTCLCLPLSELLLAYLLLLVFQSCPSRAIGLSLCPYERRASVQALCKFCMGCPSASSMAITFYVCMRYAFQISVLTGLA